MNCKIQTENFIVTEFQITEGKYDKEHENGNITGLFPEIRPSFDYKSHLTDINVHTQVFRQGKICNIKTRATFIVEFDVPYKIFEHFTHDMVLNIFSQLFICANGHLQGVFKERTKGTVFESYVIPTRLMDDLYELTKTTLLSQMN